jgi:hypothetical protein
MRMYNLIPLGTSYTRVWCDPIASMSLRTKQYNNYISPLIGAPRESPAMLLLRTILLRTNDKVSASQEVERGLRERPLEKSMRKATLERDECPFDVCESYLGQ